MPEALDPALTATGKKDDWETPARVMHAVYCMTDIVTLDPCAGMNTDLAVMNWGGPGIDDASDAAAMNGRAEAIDGLTTDWPRSGLIYANPPYSTLRQWATKVIEEAAQGSEVLVLCPNRSDTRAGQALLGNCNAVCYIAGRLKYLDNGVPAEASAPFPAATFYFGDNWRAFRDAFLPLGVCMDRRLGWS